MNRACLFWVGSSHSPTTGPIIAARKSDTEYECALVRFLTDAFLLRKTGVRFPVPRGAAGAPEGIVQHALVGRAYPERGSGDR